jgi:hypothetical protein
VATDRELESWRTGAALSVSVSASVFQLGESWSRKGALGLRLGTGGI